MIAGQDINGCSSWESASFDMKTNTVSFLTYRLISLGSNESALDTKFDVHDTSSMYSNAMAAPLANGNPNTGAKQPPSYEDCIKVSVCGDEKREFFSIFWSFKEIG